METKSGSFAPAGVVAYFLLEGQKPKLSGREMEIAKAAAAKKEFEGKAGTALLIRGNNGKILLLGMGKKGEIEADSLRIAAGRAAIMARDGNEQTLCFAYSKEVAGEAGGEGQYAQAIMEGVRLSLYKFDKYKSGEEAEEARARKLKSVSIACPPAKLAAVNEGIARAKALCEAVSFTRDIANESGKEGTPSAIAARVSKMARENGLSCRVLGRKECEKEGMRLYLSVASGSEQEPKFVVLEHKPRGAKGKVCIVGKGVTFDSGGISLKPGKDMEKMKHDKCGAAAVYGIMMAAARMKVPLHIVGITPLTENMPSGGAVKPGDIATASNGKTVEINNTDAEGRLILADALLYAQKYKPDAIIDLATLTGAASIALGPHAAAAIGNNEELVARAKEAGESTHERVWQLPLWKEYYEAIKGDFADIKNIGDGDAGTITAAAFLGNFVGETAWLHIDIAATAYSYKPKGYNAQVGATGFGVRLASEMLQEWKPLKKEKKRQ